MPHASLPTLHDQYRHLIARAEFLFANRATTQQWLWEPCPALENRLPAECGTTPAGLADLDRVLTLIEHNAFA